jgi:hypothetical protein
VHVRTNFPFQATFPVDTPIDFNLNNTVIANNGANECYFAGDGTINVKGAGNLIMQNGSDGQFPYGGRFSPCPGVVTKDDPQLQPLHLNPPGNTPTMAILLTSPAVDKADPFTSLATDQRGPLVPRPQPQGGGFDIGAFEVRPEDPTSTTTTWNPNDKGPDVTLTNGDLTFATGQRPYHGVRSVASASTGKKYWELTANTISAEPASIRQGIANGSFLVNGSTPLGDNSNGIGWAGDGRVYINSPTPVATIQNWLPGDVLSFALDLDNKRIWFRKNNGNWNNDAASNPATPATGFNMSTIAGSIYAFGQGGNNLGDTLTANFGGSPYAQSVPSGFGNW